MRKCKLRISLYSAECHARSNRIVATQLPLVFLRAIARSSLEKPNARTERRPECGGRAAAKRAVRMTHVGRSAPVTC